MSTIIQKGPRKKRTNPSNIGRTEDGNIICNILPRKLLWINDPISFVYKGNILYTGILAELFSFINNKYLQRKKKKIQLYSETLKQLCGNGYNNYMRYLEEEEIIVKIRNYYNGSHSNTYLVNDIELVEIDTNLTISNGTLVLYVSKENKKNELYNELLTDLSKVQIDYNSSLQWYKNNYYNKTLDASQYYSGLYSIQRFNSKYMIFDKYGRCHTNVTTLKKEIRSNFLKLDNEKLIELDIKNSQPLFMALLMSKLGTYDEKFFNDCINGVIYENIATKANITRSEAKKVVYKVMFGINKIYPKPGTINYYFQELYPITYEWINNYKYVNYTYKSLSREMQRTESNFVFNKLIPEIKRITNNDSLLTIHDSIMIKEKYYNIASLIFNELVDEIKYSILEYEQIF